jgi:iron(III) transport system permease protein
MWYSFRTTMNRRRTEWIVGGVLGGLLAVLLVWPLWAVVRGGIWANGHFTTEYLTGVLTNPVYAEGLVNSLKIAAGTTVLSILLALPLAWMANRYDFAGKRVVSSLLLVPMILPPFVGAIGIQQFLGQYGVLNALLGCGPVDWLGQGRYVAVILLQALSLYPILYLNLAAALANIDPATEEAAANLGASPWTVFRRITLPLAAPGLFAGGTLVFIWSFTELGTPLMLNYTRCAPVQIYDALKEIGYNAFPYALVLVMLVASVLLYVIMRVMFGGQAYAMQSRATVTAVVRPCRGWGAVAVVAPFVVVIGLALLPHVAVICTSFSAPGGWYRTVLPVAWTTGHYVEALGHEMTVSSIRNSLGFSSLAIVVNMVLGVSLAWVIVRSRLKWRGVLDALAMLPLAVPGLVMAFGYLAISSELSNLAGWRENPLWMSLVDVRTNPTLFLVIAYAVRRLPYVVRAAVAGFQQTSVAFEEAAANLGARPSTVLRRVTLPLITANLVAGALLAFAFCMLEVSDSLMLAQQAAFYPITKTIYELFQLIGTGKYVAAALGVWAMVFLAVTIAGASLILGRKLGAIFRA